MTVKKRKLAELRNKLVKDNPVPGLSSQATQIVFGAGSENADVMFVGEAPGRDEDESGEPFVGASGRMLDELLSGVNLKREDVYITNIVKYRPPENRDPTEEEKSAFWPYLIEQINIVKPKIIATLGRHSGASFLPKLSISTDHGVEQQIALQLENKETKVTVLPLYHPAAAIYNRSLMPQMKNDFRNILNLL